MCTYIFFTQSISSWNTVKKDTKKLKALYTPLSNKEVLNKAKDRGRHVRYLGLKYECKMVPFPTWVHGPAW